MTGLQMQIQAPGTVYHCVAWHSSTLASHVHAPRRRDTLHCLQAHAPQERLFLITISNAKIVALAQTAGVRWGGCTESQCKEYLLHPEERERLAEQHGASKQTVSGLSALKHMKHQDLLCAHFHMDRDHTLTPCKLSTDGPSAQQQSAHQGDMRDADAASAPETPRQTSEDGRPPCGSSGSPHSSR